MRCSLVSRLIVLAALVLIPQLGRSVVGNTPPNVLLIITDEHNFRTLGCYRKQMSREQAEMWGPGNVVPTPNLDRLADEGVICTRAYASSPVCSPCRATMITGRYSHTVGMPTNDRVLDRTVPTLADRLNDAGYRSAFFGKWHLGGTGKPEWSPKVDGGFQFKKFMFNRGHWKKFAIQDGVPSVASRKNGMPNYGLVGADEESFSTDWLTNRAIDYITDAEAQKPFFAVISYPDPHGPNTVRSPYDHRFDNLRFVKPRTAETGLPAPKWLGAGKNHAVFRGDQMSPYFGMVQCIDDNIGRLLEQMQASGRLENTLIVMTSDHGDLCYEHDRLNKGNPYEGSARVPMIFRMPGKIAASQVYTQPFASVDVTPTVMGLLGLSGNPQDHGRNLADTLVNVATEQTDPKRPPTIFLRNAGVKANWVAAIDHRYKLVVSVADVPFLFDNEQDPDELLNFYKRPGTEGVAERLAKGLRQYAHDTNDPHGQDPKIARWLAVLCGDQPAPPAAAKKKTVN